MGTRTIVLVRHGQYALEEAGALTPLGREQARVTGRYLRQFLFHTMTSSTLKRARETADLVAEHLGHIRVRRVGLLREGMYTKVEGYEVPEDERIEDRARGDAAWKRFFRTARMDRTELLVCHGNLIRYLLCRALDVSVGRWLRMTTNHCGISRVLVRDTGAVRVVSYNETAHLPPSLVT